MENLIDLIDLYNNSNANGRSNIVVNHEGKSYNLNFDEVKKDKNGFVTDLSFSLEEK